jgi:hypothetical protein
MKIFSVKEANEILPLVRPKLERLRTLYGHVSLRREHAKAAASASEFGGGMEGGSIYVQALTDIGQITSEIGEVGVQLKDHARGLIDFPCMRSGRIILLCWQLGEREEIEWWHETEAGFVGRQRL